MDAIPDPTMLEQAIERLNDRAVVALATARLEAAAEPHPIVGCHHLLLGLASDPGCVAARVLQGIGATADSLRADIRFINGSGGGSIAGSDRADLPLSPRLQHVMASAATEASRRGHPQIGTVHLLIALVKERTGVVITVLERPGLGLEPLGREIVAAVRAGWAE